VARAKGLRPYATFRHDGLHRTPPRRPYQSPDHAYRIRTSRLSSAGVLPVPAAGPPRDVVFRKGPRGPPDPAWAGSAGTWTCSPPRAKPSGSESNGSCSRISAVRPSGRCHEGRSPRSGSWRLTGRHSGLRGGLGRPGLPVVEGGRDDEGARQWRSSSEEGARSVHRPTLTPRRGAVHRSVRAHRPVSARGNARAGDLQRVRPTAPARPLLPRRGGARGRPELPERLPLLG
jgi:hypothetical protein